MTSTTDETTPPRHDHIFRNALIYDGSNDGPLPGEVAIAGERIVAIADQGTIPAGPATREHDLKGKALAPGFIDSHTHDDRIVLDSPDMLPKISQGVTTVVAGNCGISLAPVTFDGPPPAPLNLLGGKEAYQFPTFADYARAIAETTPGVNVAALVGHSSLR
ncbi:MAG: amidohydrolase family protein, partial [Bauldia litoralis]